MAAAEARAAWQRAANRCFMQEDAKRTPNLAHCPSSSYSENYDTSYSNAPNEQDHITSTFVALNWTSMNSNLPPDTRSWLHLNQSFVHQKDFTSEQPPNSIENRAEDKPNFTASKNSISFGARVDEMKTVTDTSQQQLEPKVYIEDYLSEDGNVCRRPEKRTPELDLPWEVGNKCEPWWRISDQDELASLVAQKSFEHIENCDLPRPTQSVLVSRRLASVESLDGSRVFPSSVSCKSHAGVSDPFGYPSRSWTSGSFCDKYWSSSESTEKQYSSSTSYNSPPTSKNQSANIQASKTNSSRDQLLEALRHSQNRAREAEIAAQKAHNEKDHIVQLFFTQASNLFAYKQWLHMLQVESLFLQLRIKEHQISTLFPVLRWAPLRRNEARSRGKKQKRCSFCKYVFAFAVGLGLVGAGLLLGWTLGWLMPHL